MVMDSLGIDVGASESDNMKTFKKMTVDTEVFTYAESHLASNTEQAQKLPRNGSMRRGLCVSARPLVKEDDESGESPI